MVKRSDGFEHNVGLAVRKLRHDRKWSQKALSIRSGVTDVAIWDVERGTSNPTIKTLVLIATAFEISLERLIQIGSALSLEKSLTIRDDIAHNIKKHRSRRNLTAKVLASKIGASAAQISSYENATSSMTVDTLQKIAIALDVPADELVRAPND